MNCQKLKFINMNALSILKENKKEKLNSVLELRSKMKIKEEEIKLKQLELSKLNTELFEVEWKKVSWADLEDYLKSLADATYENKDKLPKVTDRNRIFFNYCFIREDGKLQVGAYDYNNRFPRDRDLYVRFDLKPWYSTQNYRDY